MKCLYDVENVNVGLMIEVFRALNFVQHQKQQYIWFFHDIAKLRDGPFAAGLLRHCGFNFKAVTYVYDKKWTN